MKLTLKNYKEVSKGLDFSKLPKAAQDAHKEYDSFADFYSEDKDIKEMLDNHFKIVEKYLRTTSKSTEAETTLKPTVATKKNLSKTQSQ